MTAPTLAEALAELAGMVPERVQVKGPSCLTLVWHERDTTHPDSHATHDWTQLGLMVRPEYATPSRLRLLRAALEEEIESRPGWDWQVGTMVTQPRMYDATVWREGASRDHTHVAHADTPAHALLLALLAALKAEGGAQ